MGDLLEQAPTRGGFWFWKAVIQVTAAPLIPLFFDSAINALLCYEFLGNGWRGAVCYVAGGMIWDLLVRKVFRWPVQKGRIVLRIALTLIIMTCFHYMHVEIPGLR
jgi:hypothetical protein